MVQRMMTVGSSVNGSRMAEVSSGIRIMSDSLMPFQPEIEDPSNIFPSSKKLSLTSVEGRDTWCSLPLVSVKRRSIQRASASLINSNVFDIDILFLQSSAVFEVTLLPRVYAQGPCSTVSPALRALCKANHMPVVTLLCPSLLPPTRQPGGWVPASGANTSRHGSVVTITISRHVNHHRVHHQGSAACPGAISS